MAESLIFNGCPCYFAYFRFAENRSVIEVLLDLPANMQGGCMGHQWSMPDFLRKLFLCNCRKNKKMERRENRSCWGSIMQFKGFLEPLEMERFNTPSVFICFLQCKNTKTMKWNGWNALTHPPVTRGIWFFH